MSNILQNKAANELINKVFGDSASSAEDPQSSPPGGIEIIPQSAPAFLPAEDEVPLDLPGAETAGSGQDRVVDELISKIFGVSSAPAEGDLQNSGSLGGETAPGPEEAK
ncbi:MAG: hypothetical protein WB930_16070 [Syntrophobacteraceae bacterium]